MKTLGILLILIVFLGKVYFLPTFLSSERTLSESKSSSAAVVSWVADGDTIQLETGEFVRLIGIDAPETGEGKTTRACGGVEARDFLAKELTNKTVTLIRDVSQTDRYHRLLRYVYSDSRFMNEELVRLGYAKVKEYPPDIGQQELLEKAQTEAQREHRGIWMQCE